MVLEFLPVREERAVTINGYAVPKVEAFERDERTYITLDSRFQAVVPAEDAEGVIWLLANALAIGSGFTCHGENSIPSNPFKTQVIEIQKG
jgi:hypothetical protein